MKNKGDPEVISTHKDLETKTSEEVNAVLNMHSNLERALRGRREGRIRV